MLYRSMILLLYVAQGLVVFLTACLCLQLYAYDFAVPFNYSGDAVVILMYIKGLVQNGWPTTINQLSFPFSYPGAAFPILTSVDWVIIKLMSLFTSEPGYLLNGFWLLTLVFSAWSANYSAYQLGLSRLIAFGCGVLYAFLPYAWLRNVAHLNLVYYIVPLLCLLIVVVAGRGNGVRNVRQAIIVGLLACVLQGFNYIYYSFFTVILLGLVIIFTYKGGDSFRYIKLPLAAITIVVCSVVLNMLPAMQSWHNNGTPPEMGYKNIAESEIYGAKIRKMLSPHQDNLIWPLSAIGKRDFHANFPNENENTTARLGIFGAFGLLLMIYFILSRRILTQSMESIAVLGLATLLIITVGGFGAVINLLTVPDIRAYNRFSVFLSFFTIIFCALWMQTKAGEWRGNLRIFGHIFIIAIMILSFYDQLLDRKFILGTQKNDARRAHEERTVVARLEAELPNNSALLQLPFTGFPPLAKINKMDSYDHVRPYLWSRNLNWSWPSFTQRHRAWQNKISVLQGSDLIEAAIFSGFDAIWLDRFAYQDNGNSLIDSLTLGKVKLLNLESSRFVVLDLRSVTSDLKAGMSTDEFENKKKQILGDEIVIGWGNGFYEEEKNPKGKIFRWAKDSAQLTFRNVGESVTPVCVAFSIASPNVGYVRWKVGDLQYELKTSTNPKVINFPLIVDPGKTRTLKFTADVQKLDAPGDSRQLYFYILNFSKEIRDDCIYNEL